MKQESRIERDFPGVGKQHRKQRIQTRCEYRKEERQSRESSCSLAEGPSDEAVACTPLFLHLGEPCPHLVVTDPPSAFQAVVKSI